MPIAVTQCISDFAGGNPKYIEEVLDALVSAKAITVAKERESDGVMVIRSQPLTDLKAVPPPPKMRAALLQQFDSLPPTLQHLLKTVSPLAAFSQGMLKALPLPSAVLARSAALLATAVSEGILEELKYVPMEVQKADPGAKHAWSWLQLLMRDEILSNLLHSDREEVDKRVSNLKAHTANTKRPSQLSPEGGGEEEEEEEGGAGELYSFDSSGSFNSILARRGSHSRKIIIDELRFALGEERQRREACEWKLAQMGVSVPASIDGPSAVAPQSNAAQAGAAAGSTKTRMCVLS